MIHNTSPSAGNVWSAEKGYHTVAAADRRKVAESMRQMPEAVSYCCPSCGHKLDIQGIERGSRIVFDMWCHGCNAHITMRLKL